VGFGQKDVVDYRVEWSYPGTGRLPYRLAPHHERDMAAEEAVRIPLETAFTAGMEREFRPQGRLEGADAAVFADRVLSAWRDIDHVRIEGNAPRVAYAELLGDPSISLT